MAEVVNHGGSEWENYHETVKRFTPALLELVGDSDPATPLRTYLANSCAALQLELGKRLQKLQDMRPVGGAWSLSEINRTNGAVLATKRSGRVFAVAAADLDAAAGVGADRLVLASGGTVIKDLNVALERRQLSLRTSGASNGQTVAGAIATGTHGSAIDFGGIQNHVRGLHLIVSPTRSIWLEPQRAPVLSAAAAAGFADELVRNDEQFDAAVVHLGGLGIVNAVLLEVAPIFRLEVVQGKTQAEPDWIEDIEKGDFRAIARRLGHDEDPYFLQIILNPFAPFRRVALYRMLFKRPFVPVRRMFLLDILDLVEPLNLLAIILGAVPFARGAAIGEMMANVYKTIPEDPAKPLLQTWGETTPDHKNFGDLYSSSFALPRERLSEALDVMLTAFARNDGGDLVFTLRFVGKSAGTLAFTRFENNVVIDLDGVRSAASRAAMQRVSTALDASGIPYGQHWGKLGTLNAARVERDYGAAAASWRKARAELLPPAMRTIFASHAQRLWGLA